MTLYDERIRIVRRESAYKAVHGTRAQRSGRFVPTKRRRALAAGRASERRIANRRKA